ncbi:Crp/Fnr family transcriptional regulator [Desulfosoma caldarium]|uniref:Cyclic nucleotide-binding protein n=1 Tax=Desulfosoma caldarium TaxID=610254 RepID=A0A3N1UQV5_9BACT|nr:cyclic nucleotide-binding domain-containing protein [Desulfosoma caldarium]ROQ93475.1 cyclic nucleotide-binding protein [Desulfosoma caldarium]
MVEVSELAQSPFLADIPESDIQQLAQIAILSNFHEGTVLFQAKQPARSLFILKSGAVLLCFPSGRALVVRQTGQALGWSSLVSPLHYTATGICLADSVFYEFRNAELFDLFRMNTPLASRIMAKIEAVMQERKPYRRRKAA